MFRYSTLSPAILPRVQTAYSRYSFFDESEGDFTCSKTSVDVESSRARVASTPPNSTIY